MVCARCGGSDSTALEEARLQAKEARAAARASREEAEAARAEVSRLHESGFRLQAEYGKLWQELSQTLGKAAYWEALYKGAGKHDTGIRAPIQDRARPRSRAQTVHTAHKRETSWRPSRDEEKAAKRRQFVEQRAVSQKGPAAHKFLASPRYDLEVPVQKFVPPTASPCFIDRGSPPVKRTLDLDREVVLKIATPCRKRSTERTCSSVPPANPQPVDAGQSDTTPVRRRSGSVGDCDCIAEATPQYFSIASPCRQARKGNTVPEQRVGRCPSRTALFSSSSSRGIWRP